jgi:hypothetical protein
VTGGVFIVGLREVLLDRTFQPRQHVGNVSDIPFSHDHARSCGPTAGLLANPIAT